MEATSVPNRSSFIDMERGDRGQSKWEKRRKQVMITVWGQRLLFLLDAKVLCPLS